MATFIPAAPTILGLPAEVYVAAELRVLTDLADEQRTTAERVQTVAQLRNDAASDFGYVPPVLPPGN